MTIATATVEQLVAAGGKVWNDSRVYFNNLFELFGVEAKLYNTGNVSSATLDGEPISNSEFRKISADFAVAKLWVDLETRKIFGKGFGDCAGYDYLPHLAAALRAKFA